VVRATRRAESKGQQNGRQNGEQNEYFKRKKRKYFLRSTRVKLFNQIKRKSRNVIF